MKKLLFATQNKNKLKEAIEILRDKYDVSSPPALENEEELPEDFFTLPENACQKASFVAEKFNLNCFASVNILGHLLQIERDQETFNSYENIQICNSSLFYSKM